MQAHTHRLLTMAWLCSLAAPFPLLGGDWGDPSNGGRVLWNHDGDASIWRLSPEGDLLSYRIIPQSGRWEPTGIAGDKVLWQRDDGQISLWTLNANLDYVAHAYLEAPGGYRATSLSMDLLNPSACLEGDEDYFILLDPAAGTEPALVWLVSSNGQFRRQDAVGSKPGYKAVHFGIGADGRMKLVWGNESAHVEIWTLEWSSSIGTFRRVGSTHDYQGWPGTRANGFSTLVDERGRVRDRLIFTSDSGSMRMLVLDALGNGLDLVDYNPGGPWTAEAWTDLRPTCQDPPPVPVVPVPVIDVDPIWPEVVVYLSPRFRRGDANGDGAVDISDAVATLGTLFLGSGEVACEDAADANDDGAVDISDAIHILDVLFIGTATIPPPGVENCGSDPTGDELECGSYDTCE